MLHHLPRWALNLFGVLIGLSLFSLLISLAHLPQRALAKSDQLMVKSNPADITDTGNWNIILVNPWHTLPEGYVPPLTQLQNGQAIDQRCYPALQAMMDACRAAGYSPLICSSYRSHKTQSQLFANKISRLMAQGYSQDEAEQEAATVVARPGTSEHQLGLAVDIVDSNHQALDESQEFTPVQHWLLEHCWEYGFILRYPNGKSELTGIIYEPWHYRYVGVDLAQQLQASGQCLEEYLSATEKTGTS